MKTGIFLTHNFPDFFRGSIDSEEFALLVSDLGVTLTEEELAGAIDYIDADESGEIDPDEFVEWLQQT